MLENVLRHLKNWFLVEIYHGAFAIRNGGIELPFLLDGQYFRIIGSVLNDGVYRYGDELALKDETFEGAVWALSIPQALLYIVQDIEEWQFKNGKAVASPYTSESFGGYSYTKATDAQTGGAMTWERAFRPQLNQWRKV